MTNKKVFYGIRLKNSNFEKIHDNINSLEIHLNSLLYEFNIPYYFESISEKIVMLNHLINFMEYRR